MSKFYTSFETISPGGFDKTTILMINLEISPQIRIINYIGHLTILYREATRYKRLKRKRLLTKRNVDKFNGIASHRSSNN